MTQAPLPDEPLLSFRRAGGEAAEAISNLVNSAYRGDSSRAGWTTEADLLEGQRTDESDVRALIEADDSMILLCLRDDEIVGSVHLKKVDEETAYLGMFVVNPGLQGAGIGKQFLQAAETSARQAWGISKMTMTVITLRHELIAFYERRGYRRTGQFIPFPAESGASVPRVANLRLEKLEKDLAPRSFA